MPKKTESQLKAMNTKQLIQYVQCLYRDNSAIEELLISSKIKAQKVQ